MQKSAGNFNRPSLTDVAYQEIRNGILHGDLVPGKKLVVNELVDEWKISNTPIKEALNRLVADELVEALPRRGMRVRIYGALEMQEIFQLRALLEVHCSRLLAVSIAVLPDVAATLRDILDKSESIVANGLDIPRLLDLDASFHEYIVAQCGNNTLITNFQRLHAHTLAIGSAVSQNCSLGRWRDTQVEHRSVFQAILDGAPDAAEQALRSHLEKTCESLYAFVDVGRKSGRMKKRG